MNKCCQEENQNFSDLDAVYYLGRTSVIASVLLMLNSMLNFQWDILAALAFIQHLLYCLLSEHEDFGIC